LLLSLARPLKEATGRPLVCTLQGEELFIDGLPEPFRSRTLELIRGYVKDVDAFIAVSHYGARYMADYLRIPREKMHTVPLGVNLTGYTLERRSKSRTANIGFFGRITPEKGLHVLADAYRLLRRMPGCPPTSLHSAGYMAPEKKSYLAGVRAKIKEWGFEDEFRHWGEVDRETKARFYQNLEVFSMPATYDEPKGLTILEAMANGVPVVQPRRGSFVEMVENTGGGLLVEKDNPEALAQGLYRILTEPAAALKLGRDGCEAVRRDYSIERMAAATLDVYSLAGRDQAAAR
jgi:glycosyltransferase involved in cell wall biosynthesis